MNKIRFEKFEMKYGNFLPEDFKEFMNRNGGDFQFGSCRFEYPDNIINNLIRIPGKMDFRLIPFGDVGNGDYYCFYKYGPLADECYVGLWLHETSNFVVLASGFTSFMYKCLLDDYFSTIIPNDDLSSDENVFYNEESIQRCLELSYELKFDFDKVKKIKNENDYHRLMVEYDPKAIQSLCYVGKHMVRKKDRAGMEYLSKAIQYCPWYTAPYFIAGKNKIDGENNLDYFIKGLHSSLILTGYSYWEEDYLDIPEDVHRELVLYIYEKLENSEDYLLNRIIEGEDPYDYNFRLELARKYMEIKEGEKAVNEYSNAIFCCDEESILKDIVKEALECSKESNLVYLSGIIEHDLKALR